MAIRTGEPLSAAGLSAQPDEGGPLDGSLPLEAPAFFDIETLVDAQLEKLMACVPPPAFMREPEVLGGCSCGAQFYSIETAEAHRCRLVEVR